MSYTSYESFANFSVQLANTFFSPGISDSAPAFYLCNQRVLGRS
jgi:hypothetical protein